MPTPAGTETSGNAIEDISQITSAVMGHLRANPETQKRTDNIIQVFLGGAMDTLDTENKTKLEEDDEGAPPEVIGLTGYLEKKKKELLAAGYTPQQVAMILMGELGALSVYSAIANNEKKISIVRRVMAHQVKKNAVQEPENTKGPSTTLGGASSSHRSRFAMRGRGHRTR